MNHIYIVFTGCDDENYTKIIPTNVVIPIYTIKNNIVKQNEGIKFL